MEWLILIPVKRNVWYYKYIQKRPRVRVYSGVSFFFYFGFYHLNFGHASDFGTIGLIDIPTARTSADGTLIATAAIQSRTNSYAITYQATPWLEGTFRYTGFTDTSYTYDRNYEAKLRLWEEDDYAAFEKSEREVLQRRQYHQDDLTYTRILIDSGADLNAEFDDEDV